MDKSNEIITNRSNPIRRLKDVHKIVSQEIEKAKTCGAEQFLEWYIKSRKQYSTIKKLPAALKEYHRYLVAHSIKNPGNVIFRNDNEPGTEKRNTQKQYHWYSMLSARNKEEHKKFKKYILKNNFKVKDLVKDWSKKFNHPLETLSDNRWSKCILNLKYKLLFIFSKKYRYSLYSDAAAQLITILDIISEELCIELKKEHKQNETNLMDAMGQYGVLPNMSKNVILADCINVGRIERELK